MINFNGSQCMNHTRKKFRPIDKDNKIYCRLYIDWKNITYNDSHLETCQNFTTAKSYLPVSMEYVSGSSIDKELPMPSRGIVSANVVLKVHPELLINLRFLDSILIGRPTGKFVADWICVVCVE